MDEYEVEAKNIRKNLPAGYYFNPLPYELISGYLLRKIMGLPLYTNAVKVKDGVQLLDPEQHHFDEFTECHDDVAFYITNKGEREMEEGGEGSKPRTIIRTTTGYWRENKKDIVITNNSWGEKNKVISISNSNDQIIGYQKTFSFFRGKNDKTSWRMDEITVNPETVPDDIRDQTEKIIGCKIRVKRPKTPDYYEDFQDEDENEE